MKQLTFHRSLEMALVAVVCLQTGCQNEQERQSTPLLAEARADETNFSAYAAKNSYKEVGKELLERTVFETAGPANLRIELRDLFIVPGKTAEKVTLPGPAVLQVLSGEGKITTGEKSQELGPGTSLTLAQDASARLESHGIMPLVLRARIFIP
jgi:quercetin dioxygenase-like cupin family protein